MKNARCLLIQQLTSMQSAREQAPAGWRGSVKRDVVVGGGAESETSEHDDDDDDARLSSSARRPTLTNYCPYPWTWDVHHRSPDAVVVNSGDLLTVLFHPSWSNGTAAIRGTKPLDSDAVYYWEV